MLKLLLIEDDSDLRESVAEFLAFAGFQVLEAEDGYAGLTLAQTHLPDLIISDRDIPHMNGHDLFQALRKQPETAAIPFILFTGFAEDLLREEGERLGIRHYLTKPFIPNDLLTLINSIQA
jgi:DNA-binding response OmpR family regulator